MEPQEEFQNENDELLAVPVEEAPADEAPRRNTKKDLIAKIKSICEEHELPLNESDTTLQRTSKLNLQKLLAKKTEELVEKKMKHSIREQHMENSACAREEMAVATLQYGLAVLNKMIDRGANSFLPRAGYRLDGFVEAFEDPRTQNEVREILLCICRENPEIITHIANPYVRLGIVYVGAISMSLRKDSPQYKQYYGALGPQAAQRIQAIRRAHGREPQARQKLPMQPPVQDADDEKHPRV